MLRAVLLDLDGVLGQTGKYREDSVLASGVTPDAIVGSIADVPKLLIAGSASRPRR